MAFRAPQWTACAAVRRGFFPTVCALLGAAALVAVSFAPTSAQTLSLKRELPDRGASVCVGTAVGESGLVTEADRAEASRLANSASQAAIVGDHAGARDLLLRASRLDPESGGVAFLLGSAYEELGSTEAARREFCRYLALTPDAPDGAEVRTRVAGLDPNASPAVSDEGALQFRRGVAAFDLGQHDTAVEAFTQAIATDPTFGPAHYNRAVVYAVTDRGAEAAEDLRRYGELERGAEDAAEVASAVAALENPPRRYNAGAAMASSLAFPGAGHLYTGRSVAGVGFLAVAVGAVVFGELSEKIQIECRVPPTNGQCATSDVVAETREKPYRVAGYATAAAVALYSAIDAYRGASRLNSSAGTGLTITVGPLSEGGLSLPRLGLNWRGQVTVPLLGLSF